VQPNAVVQYRTTCWDSCRSIHSRSRREACSDDGRVVILGQLRVPATAMHVLHIAALRCRLKASTNADCDGDDRTSRQINGEYTAGPGDVPNAKVPRIRACCAASDGEPKPEAGTIATLLNERVKQSFRLSKGSPPHSSLTSIRTRSATTRVVRETCPWGRLNLNAFCSRFDTADASSCQSPSITRSLSAGCTVS
jgi:hypothetical protein